MMQTAKPANSFKALVEANRNAGRLDAPVHKEARLMQLSGMRLTPDEHEQARELANADERSVAWFCRRMYLRGLESYLAEQGQSAAPAKQ